MLLQYLRDKLDGFAKVAALYGSPPAFAVIPVISFAVSTLLLEMYLHEENVNQCDAQ